MHPLQLLLAAWLLVFILHDLLMLLSSFAEGPA